MKPHTHILLVDDDLGITEGLAPFLIRAGFAVTMAQDGKQALVELKRVHPDLVVMDVLMPQLDGRETLRTMRHQQDWTPVILLTQVGGSGERTMALDEGADDYINKPFEPNELVARIRAVLRRVNKGKPTLASAGMLLAGELSLDRKARRVVLGTKTIALTPKAMDLLEYLMTHPDELIRRERMLDVVWGWEVGVASRAVDARIAELRRALGENADAPRFIETVPGMGYRFIHQVNAK